MSDDHARDNRSEISLALDAQGNFLAVRIRTWASMGAYLAIRGPRPPVGNLGTLAGVYRTPAAHVQINGVFTNGNTTNPYLIQHQENPVHWQPWDQEALELAKTSNKPILLSVGYSACHWCHVMALESFESEAIAALITSGGLRGILG